MKYCTLPRFPYNIYIYILVGGLDIGTFGLFSHHIGNVIIPTDELIFFRGVAQLPTRYIPSWSPIESVRWTGCIPWKFPRHLKHERSIPKAGGRSSGFMGRAWILQVGHDQTCAGSPQCGTKKTLFYYCHLLSTLMGHGKNAIPG